MQPLIRPSLGRRIGVISDTHGLLRSEALEALEGADLILHAGDIGDPDHLDALARIAPVTAVRGNIDRGPWAEALPQTESLMIGGLRIHMIHDRKALQADPGAEGWDVVISGHSHSAGRGHADLSELTSLRSFVSAFAGHIAAEAARAV